jgi:hypothetical protein
MKLDTLSAFLHRLNAGSCQIGMMERYRLLILPVTLMLDSKGRYAD